MGTPPRANLSHEEPDAGNPHVRVCGGWGWQRPHLPGDDPHLANFYPRGEAGLTLFLVISLFLSPYGMVQGE
jgi:hypothetical protein